MRFSTTLYSLATILCASNAFPTGSVVLEKIESSPAEWVLDQSAKVDRDGTFMTLKIHLVNQGMDEFQKLAMDVGQCYIAGTYQFSRLNRCTDRYTG